jgi:hypothetical protein
MAPDPIASPVEYSRYIATMCTVFVSAKKAKCTFPALDSDTFASLGKLLNQLKSEMGGEWPMDDAFLEVVQDTYGPTPVVRWTAGEACRLVATYLDEAVKAGLRLKALGLDKDQLDTGVNMNEVHDVTIPDTFNSPGSGDADVPIFKSGAGAELRTVFDPKSHILALHETFKDKYTNKNGPVDLETMGSYSHASVHAVLGAQDYATRSQRTPSALFAQLSTIKRQFHAIYIKWSASGQQQFSAFVKFVDDDKSVAFRGIPLILMWILHESNLGLSSYISRALPDEAALDTGEITAEGAQFPKRQRQAGGSSVPRQAGGSPVPIVIALSDVEQAAHTAMAGACAAQQQKDEAVLQSVQLKNLQMLIQMAEAADEGTPKKRKIDARIASLETALGLGDFDEEE